MEERREFRRVQLSIAATIVDIGGSDEDLQGEIKDISLGGIFFDQPLKDPTPRKVEIVIDGYGLSFPAEVVSVTERGSHIKLLCSNEQLVSIANISPTFATLLHDRAK